LVDLAKYDSIIHDLSAIEAEIATLGHQLKDTEERKTELEIQVAKLRQENTFLQKKNNRIRAGNSASKAG